MKSVDPHDVRALIHQLAEAQLVLQALQELGGASANFGPTLKRVGGANLRELKQWEFWALRYDEEMSDHRSDYLSEFPDAG